jgi:hypothetical protein
MYNAGDPDPGEDPKLSVRLRWLMLYQDPKLHGSVFIWLSESGSALSKMLDLEQIRKIRIEHGKMLDLEQIQKI